MNIIKGDLYVKGDVIAFSSGELKENDFYFDGDLRVKGKIYAMTKSETPNIMGDLHCRGDIIAIDMFLNV